MKKVTKILGLALMLIASCLFTQNVKAADMAVTGTTTVKDINGDGIIDVFDIYAIQLNLLGTFKLTNEQLIAADENGDTVVDVFDILTLQKIIANHVHVQGEWQVDSTGHLVKKCSICGIELVNEGFFSGWYTPNGIAYYYTNGVKTTGWTTINNRVYYFNSSGIKQSSTGIDVSSYQGDIDWTAVKNDGIDYAIIRVGYGSDETDQDDSRAIHNMSECQRLGIPFGVYLYSYALNNDELNSEVQHVLRMIQGKNPSLGVFIDMEDADGYKSRHGLAPEDNGAILTEFCVSFCNQISNAGYKAGIYANKYYFTSILNTSQFSNTFKWIAKWPNLSEPINYPEGDYKMWQYASDGTVNGISGRVDMNVLITGN